MSKEGPSETTQQVEAFKRRIQERVGAWLLEHWSQLASGAAGAIAGIFAMYLLFASDVRDTHNAAITLQATVNQLVTQQQLNAALERIAALEQFERDARGYRPEADINPYLPRPRRARENPTQKEGKR